MTRSIICRLLHRKFHYFGAGLRWSGVAISGRCDKCGRFWWVS